MKKLKERFFTDKNFLQGAIAGGVIIAIIALIAFFGQEIMIGNLSKDKAGTTVIEYINSKLLGGQATAKLDSITSAGRDIYKLKININGQIVDGYMTKNATLFFAQTFEMASGTNKVTDNKTKPANTVTKSDKPKVELFVMSYCPYGTQIEKGIIPAVKALGDKIDFSLKFVDYAMHGQKEMTENLRQYCIDKEQNDKLFPYLTCFLKSDDYASCLKSTGINQTKVDACIKSADAQFKVTSQFTNKENWKGNFPPFDVHKADNAKYSVQGSPTLVINGAQVDSARDSASLLNTICGGFNTAPEICSTAKLSSDNPAPGFGDGTTPANSAAATAGCATN